MQPMNITKLMPLMKEYEKCLQCGSNKIGNGEGGIIVEDNSYTRFCKCGFKIKIELISSITQR